MIFCVEVKMLNKLVIGLWSLIFVCGIKVIQLIDRTDLFKIGNLALGGEAIVTDLYSSLEGQRE
jgi:hypothetical protein